MKLLIEVEFVQKGGGLAALTGGGGTGGAAGGGITAVSGGARTAQLSLEQLAQSSNSTVAALAKGGATYDEIQQSLMALGMTAQQVKPLLTGVASGSTGVAAKEVSSMEERAAGHRKMTQQFIQEERWVVDAAADSGSKLAAIRKKLTAEEARAELAGRAPDTALTRNKAILENELRSRATAAEAAEIAKQAAQAEMDAMGVIDARGVRSRAGEKSSGGGGLVGRSALASAGRQAFTAAVPGLGAFGGTFGVAELAAITGSIAPPIIGAIAAFEAVKAAIVWQREKEQFASREGAAFRLTGLAGTMGTGIGRAGRLAGADVTGEGGMQAMSAAFTLDSTLKNEGIRAALALQKVSGAGGDFERNVRLTAKIARTANMTPEEVLAPILANTAGLSEKDRSFSVGQQLLAADIARLGGDSTRARREDEQFRASAHLKEQFRNEDLIFDEDASRRKISAVAEQRDASMRLYQQIGSAQISTAAAGASLLAPADKFNQLRKAAAMDEAKGVGLLNQQAGAMEAVATAAKAESDAKQKGVDAAVKAYRTDKDAADLTGKKLSDAEALLGWQQDTQANATQYANAMEAQRRAEEAIAAAQRNRALLPAAVSGVADVAAEQRKQIGFQEVAAKMGQASSIYAFETQLSRAQLEGEIGNARRLEQVRMESNDLTPSERLWGRQAVAVEERGRLGANIGTADLTAWRARYEANQLAGTGGYEAARMQADAAEQQARLLRGGVGATEAGIRNAQADYYAYEGGPAWQLELDKQKQAQRDRAINRGRAKMGQAPETVAETEARHTFETAGVGAAGDSSQKLNDSAAALTTAATELRGAALALTGAPTGTGVNTTGDH